MSAGVNSPEPGTTPTLTFIEGGPGKRRTIWCDRLPGFGLRRYASGRATYIVQMRMAGRTRTVTLGRASVLSEHQAREVARHVLLCAQVGQDPATERRRVRAAPLFADFVEEYWNRVAVRWKPSTRAAHDKYRRNHIDHAFAGKFIDQIEPADVQRWFVALSDNAGPGGANRTLDIVKALFGRAEAWGYRAEGSNPCRDVRRNRSRRVARVLEPDELARLSAALAAEEPRHPAHIAAIRLLALTGCRLSEVLSLEWTDVRGGRVQLRDAKAGPRTVWLGDEARAVIDGIVRAKSQSGLFWDATRRKPVCDLTWIWRKVVRAAGLPRTRLHDLRHNFASHAARGSETMPMIGRLLGHRTIASTARYTHLDDRHLLAAAEQVGALILDMIGDNHFQQEVGR